MPLTPDRTAHERTALIVPIGPVERAHLEYLRLVLPETFGLPFRIVERSVTGDACYDPLRRQWNAARLVEELEKLGRGYDAPRVLGVTTFDLFIPILTFVFGLAQLGASTALISLHRLAPEFYGLPADSELLLRRVEKEAQHELGHTFGLKHCAEYACVMHYSNTVEEVDLKGAAFCASCSSSMADCPDRSS